MLLCSGPFGTLTASIGIAPPPANSLPHHRLCNTTGFSRQLSSANASTNPIRLVATRREPKDAEFS